jgi:hypothetical protein
VVVFCPFSSLFIHLTLLLHTLFESRTSKVQDLERYISDDVDRYGARPSELEKKLVGAYGELVSPLLFPCLGQDLMVIAH